MPQGLFVSGSLTHSRHPPHSRSPHSHSPHTRSPHSHALQELKDDLLDDTAWPVVMQWVEVPMPNSPLL